MATAEIVPFEDGLECLDAWFGALVPPSASEAGSGGLSPALQQDVIYGRLPELATRTVRTIEIGIHLPFEVFASANGIKLVERLILVVLLRDALDPRSTDGVRQADLFAAVGATTLSRRIAAESMLEEHGALRDLGLVECLPGFFRQERRYRLAAQYVDLLTGRTDEGPSLPRISPDPIEAFQALVADVKLLDAAQHMGCLDAYKVWSSARADEPGWDSLGPWRGALEARLEASAREETDRIGAEIRRLGLEGAERLAWALLLGDADEEDIGVKVPKIVQVTGRHVDPEAAAEQLLGPESRLGRGDCIRFNRADGPVLGRIAWLSREARGRVIPWPRGAFFVKAGVDLEALPFAPRVGFDPHGTEKQDRTAAREASR